MTVHHGDCLEVMRLMEDDSFDSVVTDPPYGLSFMGRNWDHGVPGVPFWAEALRVAKPGAHLLAFGGTRTFHRLTCAIEDAGWEVRDCVMWVYAQGFPKSLDVSKAIDKKLGAKREATSTWKPTGTAKPLKGQKGHSAAHTTAAIDKYEREEDVTLPKFDKPATAAAAEAWQGWGTALKPAWEPIIVARKPLKGTVAANVLRHGTGGINVDGCRVRADGECPSGSEKGLLSSGRWPANLIHDGSEEVSAGFPETKSFKGGRPRSASRSGNAGLSGLNSEGVIVGYGDSGSVARFFYCAKASRSDRDGSSHPTVKPTALMRYLCRLVTPPGGVVLDPFCGSGSTGKGAVLEGFDFVGIERELEYVETARRRIEAALNLYSTEVVRVPAEQ